MVCIESFCGPLRNHCYVAERETPVPFSESSVVETKASSLVENRTDSGARVILMIVDLSCGHLFRLCRIMSSIPIQI